MPTTEMSSGTESPRSRAAAQALTTAVDMAAKAYQRDGKLSGIATGLHDLDAKMGGLQHSDLIIVAGRPGMGKTALATNIAYNVAKAWQGEVRPDGHITTVNGGIVGFFSLEMSAEQLATRIIAERTGIPSSTIRRGGISEQDFEVIRDVSLELQTMKFFVDETGGLSIAQLAARARRLKRQRGLDLLVIDEAGQFSLANTLAVSIAADRLLLLGDPQQLPEVSQGTHPEPVDQSALGWLMDGRATMPAEPPSVGSRVTSRLATRLWPANAAARNPMNEISRIWIPST